MTVEYAVEQIFLKLNEGSLNPDSRFKKVDILAFLGPSCDYINLIAVREINRSGREDAALGQFHDRQGIESTFSRKVTGTPMWNEVGQYHEMSVPTPLGSISHPIKMVVAAGTFSGPITIASTGFLAKVLQGPCCFYSSGKLFFLNLSQSLNVSYDVYGLFKAEGLRESDELPIIAGYETKLIEYVCELLAAKRAQDANLDHNDNLAQ